MSLVIKQSFKKKMEKQNNAAAANVKVVGKY